MRAEHVGDVADAEHRDERVDAVGLLRVEAEEHRRAARVDVGGCHDRVPADVRQALADEGRALRGGERAAANDASQQHPRTLR